ncbi:MAG: F0F1 ATP synthase subunit epsilon [Mariprofundaceae bacterium]
MAGSFKVLVATAEREVYAGEADFLVAPGAAGELGIMPQHTPLLTALVAGELRISKGEEVDEVFVAGGFMEVQPDQVTVLADSAERATDVDEAAALAAQRHAEEMLEKQKGDVDIAAAEAELSLAAARLMWLRKKKK